ncbi:hypothetical protein Aph02nite_17180 [Actinoplanes philippinensis]|uniref:Uncharacterized protein n=1 Tax=Actinoplanes philippinensis TaxID=35752 RepID=A0A1I2B8X8_9ACTN|nr:hypothetical protein [Actinoplanes philippinensis]GIE75768.1 hypothetical protein Aph02nite_17180 [Actinoplanes philippinensis]SFE52662.1 hypothetical protein SAMN05421541_102182 [Actinoplanes philippinensis]
MTTPTTDQPTDFEIRKAALGLAVDSLDVETQPSEDEVLTRAARFETYLRGSETAKPEPAEKPETRTSFPGGCGEPGCIACSPGGLMDAMFPELRRTAR